MSTFKVRFIMVGVVVGVVAGGLAQLPWCRTVRAGGPILGGVVGAAAGVLIALSFSQRLRSILCALEWWRRSDYDTPVQFKHNDELDELQETMQEVGSRLVEVRQQFQQHSQHLQTLVKVASSLVTSLNPPEVHRRLVRGGIELAGAGGGALFLLDKRRPGELLVRMVHGSQQRRRLGDRVAVGQGSVGACAESRQPLVLRPGLPDHLVRRLAADEATRTGMCVPLLAQGELLGVLELVPTDEDAVFTQQEASLVQALCASGAVAVQNVTLSRELQSAFLQTIQALAHAVDAKDAYTQFHSNRVADYAQAMGRELCLNPRELDSIQFSATLHDIGKIAISEEILNKPGRLSELEFAVMREHVTRGAEILRPVSFPWDVIPVVRDHHERWDGQGYPNGSIGDQIHLHARMTAICDAFDAMTTNRPYRPGMPIGEALAEVRRCRGNQFDPDLVPVFLAAFDREGESIMKRYETAGEAFTWAADPLPT